MGSGTAGFGYQQVLKQQGTASDSTDVAVGVFNPLSLFSKIAHPETG